MKKLLPLLLLILIGCGTSESNTKNQSSSSLSNSNNSSLSQESKSKFISLNSGQLQLLDEMKSQGFLSINAELNKAEVDLSLWLRMKYSLKSDFAAALAIYCGNEKGTQLYWVNIYDMYSGKKLARYSKSWGFKVYD
jgi:hypothetical protein